MSDETAIVHMQLAKISINATIRDMTTTMAQLRDCFEGDLTSDSEWDLREVIGRLDSANLLLETLPTRIEDILDREMNR